jgi:hypothetical protein
MPDNIDLNRIREVYANMQDEELLHFARKEGMRITADAFLLLRAEMHKRNIGHEILFALEHEFILQDSLKRKKLTEDLNIKTLVDATEYSLTQKEKGVSNYDIYAGLVEQGLHEGYANHMVNQLDAYASELRKDARSDIQAGIFTFLLGCIALYITIRIEHFYLAAATVPIIGIGYLIKGLIKHNKLQKVLENIKKENENNQRLP